MIHMYVGGLNTAPCNGLMLPGEFEIDWLSTSNIDDFVGVRQETEEHTTCLGSTVPQVTLKFN